MEDKETYNSGIFKEVLEEMKEPPKSNVLEDIEPQDITETIHLDLNDENIDKSECSLISYGMHVDETDDVQAYNFKNNPDKAVDILFNYPNDNIKVEVFLDTNSCEWDSDVNNGCGKLSPEQMECFFKSDFYGKLKNKLENDWPVEGDEMFSNLRNALNVKKYRIDCPCSDNQQIDEKEDGIERHKRSVKLGKPNEKDRNGNKIRSSSGRKLINFSDMGVSKSNYEAYYSWPGAYLKNGKIEDTDEKTLKKVFKWSRWCDWEKQRPFLRARFAYNVEGGSSSADIIGISLSLHPEEDANRGWKSYDTTLIPSLQYLTPEETSKILNLSIIRNFMKACLRRIEPILAIPDEEILRLINKPDKCTIDDIRKTKRVIKNTLKAVKKSQADTFIYT